MVYFTMSWECCINLELAVLYDELEMPCDELGVVYDELGVLYELRACSAV